MSKTKTPFLSLSSRGSVGDALTSQKRGRHTLLRRKPTPTDPYSLPQAYQRWLYEDYAYLWRQQSAATRQQYATGGSRFHLTGFQYWMKYHLTNLTGIAGMWHLDEKAGAITYDSSKHANHGTIFGATPAEGLIDGCQYFILNDYIEITTPQLNFTSGDFSIIAYVLIDDLTVQRTLFIRGLVNADGYTIHVTTTGRIRAQTFQAAASQSSYSIVNSVTTGSWFTVGMSRVGASIRVYSNGEDLTQVAGNHVDPATCSRTAKIGIYDDKVSFPFDGRIDHMVIYNRALSPAEHKIHSERRYPV